MKPKDLRRHTLISLPILLLILLTQTRFAHASFFHQQEAIYLDYAATAPIDPKVLHAMRPYLSKKHYMGNPSSNSHEYGQLAKHAVENARTQVAELIHATPSQIIFTSGATESNNTAIKGVASFLKQKGNHIITSSIEHMSVLESCRYLETQGYQVTYIAPKKNGIIDPKDIEKNIQPDTILISVMHVNNETGAIQPIEQIGTLAKENGILFHVDAAQSPGKIPVNVDLLKADLLSLSAHKLYGPKGIGALYIRDPSNTLVPLIHGGHQEQGLRSGTLATHQIVGMGQAYQLATSQQPKDYKHHLKLKKRLWSALKKIPGIQLNSPFDKTVPNILNVSFTNDLENPIILPEQKLAVSSTSACCSDNLTPSYVLTEMGLSTDIAYHSVRLSFGRFTTKKDIDKTIAILKKQFG